MHPPRYMMTNLPFSSMQSQKRSLQHEFQGVLDNLLQLLDPFSTNGTINDAVVEAGSDDDLVIPFNGGSLLGLNGNSDLAGGTDGKDSGLRGVDDGGESLNGGVHAQVADGEGTTLVFLGLELVVASALTKVLDSVGNAGETKVVGVLDKGNTGAHPRRVCGSTRVSSNNAKHSSSSASTRVHKLQICVWDWFSAVSDQLLKR